MKTASLLTQIAQIVYITFHFIIRIPVLMLVMAIFCSFAVGLISVVAFGLEASLYIATYMFFLSGTIFGIGAATALIIALATYILRHNLMENPELYETRLVQFAGVVASFLALIVYPMLVDLTFIQLTDTQSYIGRIVYAVVTFILAMIATLSATDWYLKKYTQKEQSNAINPQ